MQQQFILAPLGSSGDVNPFLWLGKLLQARGHRVLLVTSTAYAEQAKQAGLDFLPVGKLEDFHNMLSEKNLWHPQLGTVTVFKKIAEATPEYFASLQKALHPTLPCTILAPATLFAARAVREISGCRLITVHLQPVCLLSTYETPLFLQGLAWTRQLPRWAKKAMFSAPTPMDFYVRPQLIKITKKSTQIPPRLLLTWWHSPDGVLLLFPEWFASPQPDWPRPYFQHTFPMEDRGANSVLPEDVRQFLRSGSAPLLITPGSAMQHGKSFFKICMDACIATQQRAILVTSKRSDLPNHLPPAFLHVEYLPFGKILPFCSAIIHHGGIGTLSQALRAGIPQIVIPMAHDQPDNAERLVRFKIAQSLPLQHFDKNRLTALISEAINNTFWKNHVSQFARQFNDQNSTTGMLDWLERIP